jgi:hypothetical protein
MTDWRRDYNYQVFTDILANGKYSHPPPVIPAERSESRDPEAERQGPAWESWIPDSRYRARLPG